MRLRVVDALARRRAMTRAGCYGALMQAPISCRSNAQVGGTRSIRPALGRTPWLNRHPALAVGLFRRTWRWLVFARGGASGLPALRATTFPQAPLLNLRIIGQYFFFL